MTGQGVMRSTCHLRPQTDCLQNVLKDFADPDKSAVLFTPTHVDKDAFKAGGSSTVFHR